MTLALKPASVRREGSGRRARDEGDLPGVAEGGVAPTASGGWGEAELLLRLLKVLYLWVPSSLQNSIPPNN